MKRKYFKLINLSLIVIFLLTSGFGCKVVGTDVKEKLKPITLEYWRLWDDEDAFKEIIDAYRIDHPNITISYKKFRPEEYEQALLEAWAEDRGPDIFSIDETWLKKYQTKLTPMPPQITMAYQVIRGTLKKEVIPELRTKNSPTLRQLKEDYVDVAYNNMVIDGQVYGLPLSLETLIMLYNRDILNKSGITQLPATWEDFQKTVQKITRFDSKENIVQSGTALGAGYNVNKCFDILSILMIQNDTVMTDPNGLATFLSARQGQDYNPGMEAIRFYIDFASPTKNVYTWNASMPNSLEAFLAGQVAFIFDYNHTLPTIRARAPKINLGIAPLPQVNPENTKNYANYTLEVVSKKAKNPIEAWDFILFAAQKDQVKKYLAKTARPTALKSLINEELENEDLHAAATQTLTATNWYKGKDIIAAENAIKDMLESILKATSEKEIGAVISVAIQKINQTVR